MSYLPSFYKSGYIKNFDKTVNQYQLKKVFYKKGSILTTPGVINNTAYFLKEGILHITLTHSSGKEKGIGLYGPETIFPLGVVKHENPIDYEMVISAVTDVEVYEFSYELLRKMCVNDGELAAMILEENCDFIGYLFYKEMNQSFESSYTSICDFLYVYSQLEVDISFTQNELADLVGSSIKQVERTFKDLREKKVIRTSHKKIEILDIRELLKYCSDTMKTKY